MTIAAEQINAKGVFNVAGIIHVDATYGDDGTGSRTRPGFPFQTIGAALAAAQDGDTLFVHPGTYTENPTLPPGLSFLAIYSIGLGAAHLVGNVTWNPVTNVGQLITIEDLFVTGNITTDATGKTGGQSLLRAKNMRHFGNLSCTGRGSGLDYVQYGACSFSIPTATMVDMIVQMSPIAPFNSVITTFNASGTNFCDIATTNVQFVNATIGANSFWNGHDNVFIGGGNLRCSSGGQAFLYGDDFTSASLTCDAGCYIRAFEALLNNTTLTGPGPIDRSTPFFQATTTNADFTYTIDPPVFGTLFILEQVETSNTVGGVPLRMVSNDNASFEVIDDSGGGRNFNLAIRVPTQ